LLEQQKHFLMRTFLLGIVFVLTIGCVSASALSSYLAERVSNYMALDIDNARDAWLYN